jgi:hypothetical protein
MAEIVDEVSGYIPVDRFTDWARAASIAQSLEFVGGAVDHFGSLLREPERAAKLDVVRSDGTVRNVAVERIAFGGCTALAEQNGSAANFRDAASYQSIGTNAGVLTVDTFVNYRDPVDPEAIFDPIFEQIARDGIETLILDLRANGGGSTDASQSLFAHLIAAPAQIKRDMRVRTLNLDGLRDHLSTWERAALNPDPGGFIANEDGTWSIRPGSLDDTRILHPDETAFTDELITLTSASISSGITNLSAVLRSLGRAKLVGERTGGSAEGRTAGILFTLNLPESGIKARIPVFRYFTNVESFENGMGLSPDIEAVATASTLRSGSDPAMDAAIGHIRDTARTDANFGQAPLRLSASDFAPLLGEWSGSLNHLNYGSPDRSTIPVAASIGSVGADGMRYTVRFPGEERYNTAMTLSFGADGSTLDGAPIISRNLTNDGALELITTQAGADNGDAVTVQMTYTIAQHIFMLTKDIQTTADKPFFNRNRYKFTR